MTLTTYQSNVERWLELLFRAPFFSGTVDWGLRTLSTSDNSSCLCPSSKQHLARNYSKGESMSNSTSTGEKYNDMQGLTKGKLTLFNCGSILIKRDYFSKSNLFTINLVEKDPNPYLMFKQKLCVICIRDINKYL